MHRTYNWDYEERWRSRQNGDGRRPCENARRVRCSGGTSASPGSVSPEQSESEAKKKYKRKMNVRPGVRQCRAQNKDAMTQLRDALTEHMRRQSARAKHTPRRAICGAPVIACPEVRFCAALVPHRSLINQAKYCATTRATTRATHHGFIHRGIADSYVYLTAQPDTSPFDRRQDMDTVKFGRTSDLIVVITAFAEIASLPLRTGSVFLGPPLSLPHALSVTAAMHFINTLAYFHTYQYGLSGQIFALTTDIRRQPQCLISDLAYLF